MRGWVSCFGFVLMVLSSMAMAPAPGWPSPEPKMYNCFKVDKADTRGVSRAASRSKKFALVECDDDKLAQCIEQVEEAFYRREDECDEQWPDDNVEYEACRHDAQVQLDFETDICEENYYCWPPPDEEEEALKVR